MDDGLRRAALMLSQQFVVNPQTCRVVIAAFSDRTFGPRPALLDVLLRHGQTKRTAVLVFRGIVTLNINQSRYFPNYWQVWAVLNVRTWSVQNGTCRSRGTLLFMIGREIPAEQILAIACPICGAQPKEPCELSTRALRHNPHRERVLVAKDKPRRVPNPRPAR